MERLGFANEPHTTEQKTRKFLDLAFGIFGAFAGVPVADDGLGSAHYQNPDRWEGAADEYSRSRYGPSAEVRHFRSWCTSCGTAFNQDHWFTFEVLPGELVPPWGSWKLKVEKSRDVVIEVLDQE